MGGNGTKTSSFGVSKRESHDSSKFYASRLYKGKQVNDKQPIIDQSDDIGDEFLGGYFHLDDEYLEHIPSKSVHLVIYQVPVLGIDNRIQPKAHIQHHIADLCRLKKKLITGGRMVVIIDNMVPSEISPSCFWPFHAILAPTMIEAGLYMRGEVILTRQLSSERGEDTWFQSTSLRNAYIHGLVFSNQVSRRIKKEKKSTIEKTDTITRDQFLEYTKSVWNPDPNSTFKGEDGLIVDYCIRFVHMYSFLEDIVAMIVPKKNDNLQKSLFTIRSKSILISL